MTVVRRREIGTTRAKAPLEIAGAASELVDIGDAPTCQGIERSCLPLLEREQTAFEPLPSPHDQCGKRDDDDNDCHEWGG